MSHRQSLWPARGSQRARLYIKRCPENAVPRMGSLFAGTSKCPGVARTVVKGSVYKRGKTCLNLRPCKSYACYGHTILGYEKSCAGAPQHKLNGKVRWLQKDACSFLTSCSRVVHGSGVSRYCMFAEVYDPVLVQNSQPRVPCHSACAHFAPVLCARLSILMAVLIICCASPPAWLFARLSVRGGAAGSAGRVVPGTQPGRWGATLGPPLVSLGSQSLGFPRPYAVPPLVRGLLVPALGHHVLPKTNWYLHLRVPRTLRLQLQLCAGPVHGRVPRGSLALWWVPCPGGLLLRLLGLLHGLLFLVLILALPVHDGPESIIGLFVARAPCQPLQRVCCWHSVLSGPLRLFGVCWGLYSSSSLTTRKGRGPFFSPSSGIAS